MMVVACTFGKAFAKIPYYYIKWLTFLTRNYIRNLIDEKPVLISDSTGAVSYTHLTLPTN